MIGSRRDLKSAMLQDGVMRRSDDELGEVMRRGTSGTGWRDILWQLAGWTAGSWELDGAGWGGAGSWAGWEFGG